MHSLIDGERFTLKEVGKSLNVHHATVWRWCLYNVQGRVLASFQIGGSRYVLKDDLEKFLAAGRDRSSQAKKN